MIFHSQRERRSPRKDVDHRDRLFANVAGSGLMKLGIDLLIFYWHTRRYESTTQEDTTKIRRRYPARRSGLVPGSNGFSS